MQGIVYMPDGHLQTGSPPPSRSSVPQTNMEISSELDLHAKEVIVNQSNHSDSGILSATGNSTFLDMDRSNRSENEDTDNLSNCSSPDRKYLCPICETILTSQHEFTLHIRSHNNEAEPQDSEKGNTCRICCKVLSSSASLDRHMLIHSGERPFTCRYCGDTFTTNGNMHRHMRTHSNRTENYESDGSSDSGASSGSKTVEYNNNKITPKSDSNKSGSLELRIPVDNKRKYINFEMEEAYKRSRIKLETTFDNITSQNYSCPVCERHDFNSVDSLEVHLEDNHPDYPARCNHCSQTFKNNKLLNEHRSMVHSSEESKQHRNSVVGFKDLTFVDFSSQKFPHIARYECEKNLHKVAGGLKFQCEKCSRAFPCASSLEIHQSGCIVGLDLSIKSKIHLSTSRNASSTEKDARRNDFFARLDLQNNSQENVEHVQPHLENVKLHQSLVQATDSNKDLADIQSIISMTTNGTLLQQLQAKTSDVSSTLRPMCNDSEQETQKHENEEESQDLFAAEFRKMKLRGEFPCRLCTAVFPNLRALKGHNRAHLNGNNNGTYRCNMCPHSSIDKAALIRHMRTHNGDRPYECSLCNYAFTTKANCERHLRNRHAKSTREEVKKSIIYHPSEDPSNEEISKMLAREESNKLNTSLNISSKELSENIPEKVKMMPAENLVSTPDLPVLLPEKKGVKDVTAPLAAATSLLSLKANSHFNLPKQHSANRLDITDIIQNENLKSLQDHKVPRTEQISPYMPQFNFSPKVTDVSTPQKLTPKINVKNLESLQCSEHEEENKFTQPEREVHPLERADQPMDLVLDLSKKKTESKAEEETKMNSEAPQDLSKKNADMSYPNMSEILARQLLRNTPKIDPAGLYASQLAFCRNGFPPLHGLSTWPFSLNPLLFQTISSPLLPQDPQDIKERLQRLQLCGGGMVMDNFAERLKNFHQQSLSNTNLNAFNSFKLNDVKPELNAHDISFSNHSASKPEELKPLTLSIDQNLSENLIKMQSPIPIAKSETIASPNSVKMVIKNGVLMPKQKQRRYRTERPFSCEYCSARFTLRSNMERHIKQQHPQFWSQRQRGNVGSGGRKTQSASANHRSNYCNINIPNYDTPKKQDYDDTKDNQISEKIKYVILAQHLKAAQNYKAVSKQEIKIKEEDDDFALVIDEKDEGAHKTEDQVDSNANFTGAHENESNNSYENNCKAQILEEKIKQLHPKQFTETVNADAIQCSNMVRNEDAQDLVPVSRLLDNASQQPFKEYFRREEGREGGISEEDEEGLVASSSTSEGNISGTDENRSESENANTQAPAKKKSAYSLAPNRVSCPYCQRKFPWTSSLRRHVLTHTGQKPFKCSHCPLLFTTKSNCDRHLLRKHGNSATAVSNSEISGNSTNYMMRNVPERPFKCSSCPSSTFSTYSNLKKHMSCKHSSPGAQSDDARSQVSTGYEAGSSEDEKMSQGEQKSDWDKQITSHNKAILPNSEAQSSHLQNSDLPFKCHLCDNSFGERNEAVDHIKERHCSEYELLMSKNALDVSATTPDENPNHDDNEDNEVRGKFPDYANRKVICAFCMRRFWSAEDLRRHMRTHTGERPFSCDICHRRFTLKHSMLRHRKKHNVAFESDNLNSDEDVNNANLAPSYDKFVKKGNCNHMVSKSTDKTDESDGTEGSDLISNLLGIRDRSIIEQVLTASADDAAKLLGVKGGEQE